MTRPPTAASLALASASRRAAIPAIGFAGRQPGPRFGWFAHGAPPFVPGDHRDNAPDVGDLLLLGGGVGERLTAGVIGIWCERLAVGAPGCDAAKTALYVALASRVTEAVRSWLGDPELEVTVRMAEPPAVRRAANGSVEVTVAFEWLRDVWMHRRSVLLGRLALTCTPAAATDYRLLTVGPELGAPASTTVSW